MTAWKAEALTTGRKAQSFYHSFTLLASLKGVDFMGLGDMEGRVRFISKHSHYRLHAPNSFSGKGLHIGGFSATNSCDFSS